MLATGATLDTVTFAVAVAVLPSSSITCKPTVCKPSWLEVKLTDGPVASSYWPSLSRGSVYGELAFFDSKPRSASIRATRDGQVLRLSRKGFEEIAAWNPRLAQQFLFDLGRILAHRFRSELPYKI